MSVADDPVRPVPVPVSAEALAGRWFALRVEDVPLTLVQLAVLTVLWLPYNMLTFSLGDLTPRDRMRIHVVRRDDGSAVATFPEKGQRRISRRMRELRERLLEQEVAGFCRDLEIPASMVEGPGAEIDEDALVET
ncbi:hypothetical protein [Nocardioides sp. BYT-33-1]|uniref:hypothetical protein n=1 Tax=Nocardioides sp. BYT-33-1 TaxID=3416952 RepID=UPI003F531065